MTNYGISHNFLRCVGKHAGRCPANADRRVKWFSNDPRMVAENKFGITRSIWVRSPAEGDKRWRRIKRERPDIGGSE